MGESMESASMSRAMSISEFVDRLRKFSEPAFRSTEEVFGFLQSAPVLPESLVPYLSWERRHYTRNLIDKTPLYELLAICWESGQVSSVHNHRDQNCWMAAPIGRLRVENYRVISQDVEGGKCRLEPADFLEIHPARSCFVDPREPVHRVVNPPEASARAVSLHIYSRPFDSCVVYSPEQGTCGEIRLHYNTEYGKPSVR
jgi:cysteine dioxygenase